MNRLKKSIPTSPDEAKVLAKSLKSRYATQAIHNYCLVKGIPLDPRSKAIAKIVYLDDEQRNYRFYCIETLDERVVGFDMFEKNSIRVFTQEVFKGSCKFSSIPLARADKYADLYEYRAVTRYNLELLNPGDSWFSVQDKLTAEMQMAAAAFKLKFEANSRAKIATLSATGETVNVLLCVDNEASLKVYVVKRSVGDEDEYEVVDYDAVKVWILQERIARKYIIRYIRSIGNSDLKIPDNAVAGIIGDHWVVRVEKEIRSHTDDYDENQMSQRYYAISITGHEPHAVSLAELSNQESFLEEQRFGKEISLNIQGFSFQGVPWTEFRKFKVTEPDDDDDDE